MKKLTKVLCMFLAMCMLLASVAMAQGQMNGNVSGNGEISQTDMANILEKLNSGLDARRRINALPMEATIDIPDDFVPDDSPYEHFYPENMTDADIEAVIERIANGENVIFGDGVTMEYFDEDPSRWKSGTNATHQWITSRAFTILQKDKPSVYNWFMTSERSAAIEYSDWPDKISSGETSNTYSWHFYNYPTGKNYYQNFFDSITARSRFVYWYNQAVTAGRNANWVTAAQHLGKAIHYLSDIGAPPHTGDMTSAPPLPSLILAPKHSAYESDAQDRRTQYAVATSTYYSWYTSNTATNIAHINASISYGYYGTDQKCYSSTASIRNPTIEWPMKYVQQDIAGLLFKYYNDVT